MKYILMLVLSTVVFTVNHVKASSLSVDPANSVAIQGFSPDPYATLSVKGPSSQMINIHGRLAWQFISTGSNECIGRILPAKDKLNYPRFPIFGGESLTYVVHKNATFLNLSGCTGVLLQQ